VPLYDDLKQQAPAFETLALYQTRSSTVGGGAEPERLTGMGVTPSFFPLLREQAAVGRVFTEDEGQEGKDHEVVLSDGLWRRMFKGDPGVVGKDLRLNDVPYTIVGVMPPDFEFEDPDVRFWTPLAFSAEERAPEQRHSHSWSLIARLAPGATLDQAREQIAAVNQRETAALPAFKPILENAGFTTYAVPLQQDLVRNVRAVLYLLWGGALFVLLIGAVNVTNLVLVRSSVRMKELATRHILGASRGRIARQLVTETLLLALAGGALGLLLGYWGLGFVDALGLKELPRGSEIHMDGLVVAFVAALAAVIGVVVGLAPVVAVTRVNLSTAIQEEGRSGTASRGARLTRRALVTAQVSIACVLLIGAGLLLASFQKILAVSPGFTVQGVVTGSVNPTRAKYADGAALRAYAARALAAIRALPGVTAAGLTDSIPFGDNHSDSVILAEGYTMAPGESMISPSRIVASPGYFQALGIPLLKGRFFDERDTADSQKTVIVDEKLAKKFWPDRDPLGHRLYYPSDMSDPTAIGPKTRVFTVVGVVGTIKDRGLVDADDRVGAYYFPYAQASSRRLTFAVRAAGEPQAALPAIRRALAGIDPEMPLYDVHTMGQRVEESLQRRRTPMLLAVAFGVIALFLSAVGIYGVLAYQVTQRSREIGVRLALGATRGGVFALILREGAAITAVGLVVGLAGVVVLRQVLQAQLYGIGALDPIVLAGVVLLLAAVALVACLLPAGRATRIDPNVALTVK
jgi:predicted permease